MLQPDRLCEAVRLFFILKESASFKIKNAPRGPHRPGDGGTGRTGTE